MSEEFLSVVAGDLRIGEYLVRPRLKRVMRLGEDDDTLEEHSLPDKAMAVLVHLAANAHDVCARDDLLDAVWGVDRDVYDRVLDNAIAEIRRAFGDDSRSPTYVQTVTKRGYRLLFDPDFLQSASPAPNPPSTQPSSTQPVADVVQPAGSGGLPRSLHFAFLLVVFFAPLWLVGAEPAATTISISAPSADLYRLVRAGILDDAQCLRSSHLGVTRRSRADLQIEIGVDENTASGNGVRVTTAHVRSGDLDQVVAVRQAQSYDSTMDYFQREIRRAVDHVLCEGTLVTSTEAACFCLSAAQPLLAGQRPSKALPLLERAVDLDPQLLKAYDALARAYAVLGQGEKAEAAIREGLSRLETVDSDIALVLRRRLAHLLKDYATEWEILSALGQRHPQDVHWITERAKHLTFYRGGCAEALQLLTEVPEPIELAAGLERARALMTCGRLAETIEVLTELVARAPLEVEGRKWLVAALAGHRRFDEARQVASEVLALAPDDMEAMMLRAWIANATASFTEAIHWARSAREVAKYPADHQRIDQLLLQVALNRRDYSGCLELSADLEPLESPTSSTLLWLFSQYYFRGLCLLRSGDLEGAREILEELRSRLDAVGGPREAEILTLEAEIEFKSIGEGGSPERVLEAFEKALAKAPSSTYIGVKAGAYLEALGDEERAESFYRRALAVHPYDPWGQCRLGLLYRRQGRDDEALGLLSQAMEVLEGTPDHSLFRRCIEAHQTLRDQASSGR